uniref:SH2 domain-containing protein 6 isoform X5 n=1 Tax=Podarcis muralis TaxID=64176 RepID=UPI00109F78CB|nr:SH2 domain-containing protein 6 isoform X5 [Podarcis muralis]
MVRGPFTFTFILFPNSLAPYYPRGFLINKCKRKILILFSLYNFLSFFLQNIFGKNKTPSRVPPVPPKRPEKQLQGVPSDTQEEEEDDLYTYEVPPSKGQSKQMVPALAENIYLVPSQVVSLPSDRPALRRFSEPHNLLQPKSLPFLSKPGADGDDSSDGTFNFLAIERALQKGMMKQSVPPPLPLSARRGSLPVLGPSGSQAKAVASRDPLPALKDDEEETQEESIYVECEPRAASVPRKVLPCPTPVPPVQPLKQARPAITPSGPQKAFVENLCKGVSLKSGSVPELDFKNTQEGAFHLCLTCHLFNLPLFSAPLTRTKSTLNIWFPGVPGVPGYLAGHVFCSCSSNLATSPEKSEMAPVGGGLQ